MRFAQEYTLSSIAFAPFTSQRKLSIAMIGAPKALAKRWCTCFRQNLSRTDFLRRYITENQIEYLIRMQKEQSIYKREIGCPSGQEMIPWKHEIE